MLRDILASSGVHRLGYLYKFVQQVLIVGTLILVFSVRGRTGGGTLPLLVFICTGYPIFMAFMSLWSSVSGACQGGGGGLLMFPQITQLDLIIASIALEMCSQTVGALIVVTGLVLIGNAPLPADPLAVMMAYWGVMWLGIALGFVTGAIARYWPTVDDLIRPLKRLSIFLCGVVMVATDVPSFAMPYFSWNPVFKGLEIARQSWYPAYHSPMFKPWDLLIACVFMSAVGLLGERITRRNATK